MNKRELRKLQKIEATDKMMSMAKVDIPVQINKEDIYKHSMYLRCMVLNGILKVAVFKAESMRLGSNQAIYEVFLETKEEDFITYDVIHHKWRNARLDVICYSLFSSKSEVYIDDEDKLLINTYLRTKNEGVRGISEFQYNVKAKQLVQRYKRETAAWDEAMALVPELPEDWHEWVNKTGITKNYIFYQYDKKGATKGYCTWCEKNVPISRAKHNTDGICSCCGHPIQYKSIGKAGSFNTGGECVYLLQKYGSDCEFVVRRFNVTKYFKKGSYENPSISFFENERVILDSKLKLDVYCYGQYKQYGQQWVIENEFFSSFYVNANYSGYSKIGRVYRNTLHQLENELNRTGLIQMIRDIDKLDVVKYLCEVGRHPYVEQLVKANLTKLAYDVVYKYKHLQIDKIGELGKALQIDKHRMSRLRDNNGGMLFLNWLKYEKENSKNIPDVVLKYFETENIEPKELKFISDRMSEIKICNYLKKQYFISGREAKQLLSTWADYLIIAGRLKMETSLEIIYKPKNLIYSHDDVVLLCGDVNVTKTANEIANTYPKVETVLQSIKAKYEFEDSKYAVIVPSRIEDIILEGKILGHCLHWTEWYFERIQTHESYIMFLRKKEDIEKPYYTLEVQPGGTVRQKRTVGDKQLPDIEEAKKFIQRWQKHILNNLEQKDIHLAKRSDELREFELNELRRTKAKIRNGYLAGHLLADVLEEDLMEVSINLDQRMCG